LVGVILLVVGLTLVIGGAELFFDGLLATAARWRFSPFVLTVLVSGFELENLAAGIAANLKGLGNAAAGTFLGGTTFLALAVAGLGAAVAPIRAVLPAAVRHTYTAYETWVVRLRSGRYLYRATGPKAAEDATAGVKIVRRFFVRPR
jgi:Ca2+/Na+ antiporter